MISAIERQEKQQRRVFHAMASRLGMTEEERRVMMSSSYGVESSADLDAHQLTDLIHTLDRMIAPDDSNVWRKRLIASICEYLRLMNKTEDVNMAKSIACRASGKACFGDIPKDRLKSLYNAFKKRCKDLKKVAALTDGLVINLSKLQQGGLPS